MSESLLRILFESDDLLVVDKPAGLVCHPTKGDAYSSLVGRLRLHLPAASPRHLINRLDRETSGLVLVGKDAAAALELRQLWENRTVSKEYLAIVHGHCPDAHGVIDAPLGKDDQSAVAIKNCVRPDGSLAQTEFWVLKPFTRPEGEFSLLKIVPRTGRKHQIRIHLAHRGWPIVGDKLYGGDEQLYLDFIKGQLTPDQRNRLLLGNQALHAWQLQFSWRGKDWEFKADPEPWFAEFASLSRGAP